MLKKKIIILGSTGSIGINTLQILKKKQVFKVVLLSTNKNFKKLFKQAKEFNVKNLIISNYDSFIKAKKINKDRFNIYNNFDQIKILFQEKEIFYSMVAIVGLDGLKPSILLSKYSKNLAIVNKEAIICGWNLIKSELIKNKTNFIPIDSEHYSIFSLLKDDLVKNIKNIYITASGGPFLNTPKNNFHKVSLKDALNHPNWKMGKKISIDSSTLMNKVFEVIEAKNIFSVNYNQIKILVHPNSYIHSILEYKNGLIKIAAHNSDMKIPIMDSLKFIDNNFLKKKFFNINFLNDLKLSNVDTKKFPLINLLKVLPERTSLYETALVTINDYYVEKFIKKKISYNELIDYIYKACNLKEFQAYKNIKPKNVNKIYKLRDYVRLKLRLLSI